MTRSCVCGLGHTARVHVDGVGACREWQGNQTGHEWRCDCRRYQAMSWVGYAVIVAFWSLWAWALCLAAVADFSR